jgi:NAD(P)-dependent dehydrogenase (short-subunit alcohol dehydrogenase family)
MEMKTEGSVALVAGASSGIGLELARGLPANGHAPGLVAKILSFAGELPPRIVALEVNRWLLSRRTRVVAGRSHGNRRA